MPPKFKIGVVIDADAGRAKRELKDVDSQLNNFGKTASRAVGSFAGNIAADAVSEITGAAVDAGTAIFNFTEKLNQTEKSFETFTGSAAGARTELDRIIKFARDKPFDFDSFTNLSIRLRGVKQQASEIPGVMEDIGNAVAATGELTDERFSGVGKAIAQILGKGKVSAEEMEQLAERNINAWGILEDQLKRPQNELRKLAEQGQISSDLLLKAFRNFSRQNYGEAMEKQSKTFGGAMKRIENILLVTASRAFEPFYENVAKFTSNFADSLEKNETELKSTAYSFGEAFGKSFADGFKSGSSGIGLTGPQGLVIPGGGGSFTGLIAGLLTDFSVGVFEGSQQSKGFTAQLKKIKEGIKDLKITAEDLDLSKELNLKESAEDAKKLAGIVDDLTSQIAFFGRETVFAATQQKLIAAGFTDLSAADAQRALGLAKTLDRLKELQDEQQKYNDKLKNARDYMTGLQEQADFDLRFPKATELDRFNDWVQKNTLGLRELQGEVNLTREAIQNLLVNKDADVRASAYKNIDKLVEAYKQGDKELAKTDLFKKDLESILDPFALKSEDVSLFKIGATRFIEEMFDELSKARNDAEKAFIQNTSKDLFQNWAKGFKTSAGVQVFADNINNLEKLTKLFTALSENFESKKLTEGLEKLDTVMGDLKITSTGLVEKTDLDKLNELLADPAMTNAIKERAKALGLTVRELENLLRIQASPEPQKANQRPGTLQTRSPAGGVFQEELDQATGRIRTMDDVIGQLGATATDVFMQMGEGLGAMLDSWVLLGDAADVSFKKMVASVLAGVAAQSATLAVFHTAMGIAALTPWGAAVYGPAPLHFKAAAIWGTIAVATALLGRAAAGDSFSQSSGGKNENSPDYFTASDSNSNGFISQPANSNSAINRDIGRLAEAVDGLQKMISTSSPGDVLVRGSNQKRGFLAERTTSELTRNSTQMKKMGKALNLK